MPRAAYPYNIGAYLNRDSKNIADIYKRIGCLLTLVVVEYREYGGAL